MGRGGHLNQVGTYLGTSKKILYTKLERTCTYYIVCIIVYLVTIVTKIIIYIIDSTDIIIYKYRGI